MYMSPNVQIEGARTMTDQKTQNHAFARSRSNAGLEREKFEAWINHPKALERFSGSSAVAGFYVREDVQMQWEAWEAALRSNVEVSRNQQRPQNEE